MKNRLVVARLLGMEGRKEPWLLRQPHSTILSWLCWLHKSTYNKIIQSYIHTEMSTCKIGEIWINWTVPRSVVCIWYCTIIQLLLGETVKSTQQLPVHFFVFCNIMNLKLFQNDNFTQKWSEFYPWNRHCLNEPKMSKIMYYNSPNKTKIFSVKNWLSFYVLL